MDEEQGQTQGGQQQPTPGIDQEALGKLLEERLSAGLRQYRQEEQTAQQQAEETRRFEQQQQEANERAAKDTFGNLLTPYLQPVAQQLQFDNAATRDYVQFYTGNPEAVQRQAEIEAKFQEMAKQNRAIPREDINTWLVGREKIQADRAAAQEAALKASTLNPGVGQREQLLNRDPYEMTQDELSSVLNGVSF